MQDLLQDVVQCGQRYLDVAPTRRVFPTPEAVQRLSALDVPLQAEPLDPRQVLAELDEIGGPATVTNTGGRYFGFVTGGSLPAALAATLLAGVWDQNVALTVMSPIASTLEQVCRQWLVSLLGLPSDTGVGFVTGTTVGNFTGLAAARHAVLAKEGWDVEAQGLFGAPPITVIIGDEAHASLLKGLAMVGFGRERVVRVPTDGQGRMRVDALPRIGGPTIVCAQVGNVNTGACDAVGEICERVKAADAWVHVDGAFGLWAAAAPTRAHLVKGLGDADSWATDAHKWLNTPYDSGLVFVRQPAHLHAAMSASAAYLMDTDTREPMYYVPESSRRARGIEVWAALRSLGRQGLADLIERTCQYATLFAEGFKAAGYEVLNEVVLNQVLVSFGSDDRTRRVLQAIQNDGTCWCGSTVWHGRAAMRVSVSSWATTEDDVRQSLAAMLRLAAQTR